VLLPHLRGVAVDQIEYGLDVVEISARVRAVEVACQTCGVSSSRVHSRYSRRLHDGALGGRRVVIRLVVRRLFCVNSECSVVTFAEQAEGLSAPYRRRTQPLLAVLEQVGLALAGRAGARLAAKLGIPVHRTTLLRLVRALPEPEITTAPRVLGVDDFALRRGHVYGTILVDLVTHTTIDLLEGREAEPLTQWLREHPGAEVICRDRAGAYAEGATAGAPQAIQVADRFHLWRNLGTYVEKTVVRHRACLKDSTPDAENTGQVSVQPPQPSAPEPPHAVSPPSESRLVVRTRERYTSVQELLANNESLLAITRILQLDRKTVQRFARAATVEELLAKSVGRSSLLNRYKPYLHQRWNEGVTDATLLTKEITVQGYTGSHQTVRRYLQPFREMLTAPPVPPAVPKVRRVTGWIMTDPDNLDTDQQEKLTDALTRCPHLDAVSRHVGQFAKIMLGLEGDRLDTWISEVEADDLPELHSFTAGLRRDHAAVLNGLTLPHSSGAVEGSVNKLKARKRQMYGRAKLDLLRKLVIST
jgi:transposase